MKKGKRLFNVEGDAEREIARALAEKSNLEYELSFLKDNRLYRSRRQLAEQLRLVNETLNLLRHQARIAWPGDYVPPTLAEFLLTALATSRQAEAVTGDLNERFTDDCEKLGRPRAVRLYWARTLRSLWPLLRRAIGKALKWGAVIAAVRRLF
jgi:hypothetical protein